MNRDYETIRRALLRVTVGESTELGREFLEAMRATVVAIPLPSESLKDKESALCALDALLTTPTLSPLPSQSPAGNDGGSAPGSAGQPPGPMKASLVYGEYDCGRPCTPNGCPGHESTIPEGIEINGWTFVLDGCQGDSLPFLDDPREMDRWKRTLEVAVEVLNAAPNFQELPAADLLRPESG
jgi:hypothetical protein